MKSVLVIGLGRFGRHMARKLIEEGNTVLAVEKDETRADAAVEIVHDIQIGDAANELFMRSLGVGNFDLCVVAVGDNFQSALEITVLLKDLGAQYVLARASRDVHRKLLLRNGADYVVYAERDVAERLAKEGCISSAARRIVNHFSHNGLLIYDELVPKAAEYGLEVSYDGMVVEI